MGARGARSGSPGIPKPRSLVLDAGALIAIEQHDPGMRAVLRTAAQNGLLAYVPSAALAQVWRGGSGGQANLARFLKGGLLRGHVQIVDLDHAAARQIGVLLGATGTSDVTDAMVAWWAQRVGGLVYTSDPADLVRFLPASRIRTV